VAVKYATNGGTEQMRACASDQSTLSAN